MKGIVFTEFLEMVEDQFSMDMADQIIDASDLSSGGAYTTIGTYHHNELLQLVEHLSKETGIAGPTLVRDFGTHLFGRFVATYPQFFEGIDTAFDFIQKIEDYIHVEVRKLYPDAELPSFEYDLTDERHLTVIYRSSRPFANLAEGLMIGCIGHFDENIDMMLEDISGGEGTSARFILTKHESDNL